MLLPPLFRSASLVATLLLLSACAGGPSPFPDGAAGRPEGSAGERSRPSRERAVPAPLPALADEDNVFFGPGEVRLEPEELLKLAPHAARLKADPRLSVTLVGHTDDLGSPAYNLAIAQQRVDAVFEALRGQGVARTQIRRYPVGAEKAPPGCRHDPCRRRQRRVELIYGR